MTGANTPAPASRRLEPGSKPALLVVDFVRAYLVPGSPLYAGVETARAAAERLLGHARAARIPVLHTNVAYEPGGAEWRRLEQVVVDPPTIPGGYEIVVTVPLADPEPPPPGRWRVLAWLDGHPPLVEWFGR